MAIKGLLSFIRPSIEKEHLSKYQNKKIAVDASCLLYQGAYACSEDLCLGFSVEPMLKFFTSRMKLLMSYQIIPLVVFDGSPLPIKSQTLARRNQLREQSFNKALLLLRKRKEGTRDIELERKIRKEFNKSVKITPQMCKSAMLILDEMQIEYLVAPFESDAQLAFLNVSNQVEAVLSEDSDLIPFGCLTVLFKLDSQGYVEQFRRTQLFATDLFCNWNEEMLLLLCVLSGCDYLNSIPNIGVRKAYTLIDKYRQLDNVLSQLFKQNMDSITPMVLGQQDLYNHVRRALWTFKYQRVYDMRYQVFCPLHTPVKASDQQDHLISTEEEFLGKILDSGTMLSLVEGKVNPVSFEALTPFVGGNGRNSERSQDRISELIVHESQSDGVEKRTPRIRFTSELVNNNLRCKRRVPSVGSVLKTIMLCKSFPTEAEERQHSCKLKKVLNRCRKVLRQSVDCRVAVMEHKYPQ